MFWEMKAYHPAFGCLKVHSSTGIYARLQVLPCPEVIEEKYSNTSSNSQDIALETCRSNTWERQGKELLAGNQIEQLNLNHSQQKWDI